MNTVLPEYTSEPRGEQNYQSEADLEAEFIQRLTQQGYEYLSIRSEADLIQNLRVQLEKLNGYPFTSNEEWNRFFKTYIAKDKEEIEDKTRTIQEDHVKVLQKDDGTSKNIKLIDKKDISKNHLQVINQYAVQQNNGARHDNRYDVTILVNGLPLIHVELKRRGVSIRQAFNQIERYQRESFWSGCGLYKYVQIFVISNGTETKYYSNTTRAFAIEEKKKHRKILKTSSSFEFTSYWADQRNQRITDLTDFTRTFFQKETLLNILTRYCVFTSEKVLMVMRPYQIAATEQILDRIEKSSEEKNLGNIGAGGYIWHTTGSGKTLTSFKTSQLATAIETENKIKKVLFVVDRKDLDYQTMKEYDRFEKGAANSNTSTLILQRQLEDDNAKIIITTIQKLSRFVAGNEEHPVYQKHIVIIFDECHRSQFGAMHTAITGKFQNYHIFGFTGTPIFSANANLNGGQPNLLTTEQTFGDKLHTYTILDAINDKNVLPFRVDYISTIRENPNGKDEKVKAIDTEKALKEPKRISDVAGYILKHFKQKTRRDREGFGFTVVENVNEIVGAGNRNAVNEQRKRIRMKGFNSIFATASIDFAKLYYEEFKKQQKDLPEAQKLKIALIYSYGANEEVTDDFIEDENNENTEGLDQPSRDFLDGAIKDYNQMFHTNYDTKAENFQNYYKDLSLRMKNREIDLLIVCNMFLTGFDAPALNTLWVDKNLQYHGLLQAYSRTNRILNSIKTYGNIVCFRNLEQATNNAIALFGDENAGGKVLLRNYQYYYDEYSKLVKKLKAFPDPIISENQKKEFIRLFGNILRLRNILSSFDEFEGKDLLTEREFQDYQSIYLDLYQEFKPNEQDQRENINDDLVFEIELVKQVEINIDYILQLIQNSLRKEDKEIEATVDRVINSSLELRSKRELIHKFIKKITPQADIYAKWQEFVQLQREEDLNKIIEEEELRDEKTRTFIQDSFRNGVLKTIGRDIDGILSPMSLFDRGRRQEKKKRVIERLLRYFETYYDLFDDVA